MDDRAQLQKEYQRLNRAYNRAKRLLEELGTEWLVVANKLNQLDRGSLDRAAHSANPTQERT